MDQLNMFDTLKNNFKIDKPVRLIELFAGIGTQAMALRECSCRNHGAVVRGKRRSV